MLTMGGVPLFSKDFRTDSLHIDKEAENGNVPVALNHQLFGSLITAMLHFCEIKVGMPVSFIRFQESKYRILITRGNLALYYSGNCNSS